MKCQIIKTYFKGNGYTSKGDHSEPERICLPSQRGLFLKERILFQWEHILLRVAPFEKGFVCQRSKLFSAGMVCLQKERHKRFNYPLNGVYLLLRR